jgi:hypothetical protein
LPGGLRLALFNRVQQLSYVTHKSPS